MTNSEFPTEPQVVGDVLQDLDAVLDTEPDPARRHDVARTDVQDKVSFLMSEINSISEVIRSGKGTDDLKERREHLKEALLHARTDEIATRDLKG